MDEAVRLLREGREAERVRHAELTVQQVKALDVASFASGTVVRFIKSFGMEKQYTYLALKVDVDSGRALWYITGTGGAKTNEEFEEFLADNGGFDAFDMIDVDQ